MKRRVTVIALAVLVPLAAQTIKRGGVVNAASQAMPGLPAAGIAQGSIFLINGTDLGDTAQAGSPLDVTLAGTSVQVTVGGTSLAAPIVATTPTQVTAIMPSAIPTGSGTVTVAYNGTTSATAPVQVVATGFGIFTLNNSGSGPAQLSDGNGNAITIGNAAQPGQTVVLSGTGLGASSTDDVSAPPQNDLSGALSITIYVGLEQTTAQYAGRAGTNPGQDQISFTIPGDAITGCSVPVAVLINNTPSNFASIPISAGGACSDANGLSSDQSALIQQALAAGGNLRVASLSVSRSLQNLGISLPPGIQLPPGVSLPSNGTTIDTGSASFFQYDATQIAGSLGALQFASLGGCLVFSGTSVSGALPTTLPLGLDAGSAITISGSKGAKQLTGTAGFTGEYSAQLGTSTNNGQLYLDPGTFTFSGPGGADVGAFQGTLQMPAALTWPNPPTTVKRTDGVTVNWTGGAANSFVSILGISTGTAPAGLSAPAGTFVCFAPANAGTFTVPAVVTLSLPASASSGQGPISIPQGFMGLANAGAPVSFTAPGIDIGIATASSSVMQPVSFQ